MFCPKCASAVVAGQRFCRSCGLKLDVIVDAIEGKARGPFDFDMLKRDLRDLGANLRAGFEGAGIPVGKTQKLNKNPAPQVATPPVQMPNWQMPDWRNEINRALWKVKAANTRKYSLQQAVLSLFGGGAMMAAWYYLLKTVATSGLIDHLQDVILHQTGEQIDGIIPIIQKLWLLALIPMARGTAHLINGIFIAPKKIEAEERASGFAPGQAYSGQSYYPPVSPISSGHPAVQELQDEAGTQPQPGVTQSVAPGVVPSVTEDETLRFGPVKG